MTKKRHVRAVLALVAVSILCVAAGACSRDQEQPAAPQDASSTPGALNITFTSDPNPPRMGDNAVEVVVKQPDGAPVVDAIVSAVFSMPAMPSMNMPAMRTAADLEPQGPGVYRGTGQLLMAGTWNVSVTVTRGSEQVSTRNFSVVAK